jgi:peptide/nickel transport system substrate-binding protein
LLVPSGDVTYRQVASALQSDLKKVGITVEIQTIEGSSQYSTTKAGNYEMSLSYATSDTIDPDQLIALTRDRVNAFHASGRAKRTGFTMPSVARSTGPTRQFRRWSRSSTTARPSSSSITRARPMRSRSNVEGFVVCRPRTTVSRTWS